MLVFYSFYKVVNVFIIYLCRENSIRSAFQCLQVVVTDYLPVLPRNCLPLTVETTCKFGTQTQELNVSLTAIGLMVKLALFPFFVKLCVLSNLMVSPNNENKTLDF